MIRCAVSTLSPSILIITVRPFNKVSVISISSSIELGFITHTSMSDAIALVEEIAKLDHIRVKGLMTIAPFVENPEDNRQYFRGIKQLSVDIAGKNIDNVSMNILSMGMTGDYTVAIEEGATMVRVGTGIFGARDYGTAS